MLVQGVFKRRGTREYLVSRTDSGLCMNRLNDDGRWGWSMGVRRSASGGARGALSSFVQGDDWQIPPSLVEADVRDSDALQHFFPSSVSIVDLMRSAATEAGVRPMSGVPFEEHGELVGESVSLERHDDPPTQQQQP